MGWIRELFPNSPVIHLVRNPRDVAYSLLRVDYWRGHEGPARWRWGPLDRQDERLWEKSDRSPVVLAALQFKKILSAHREALAELPQEAHGPILEITYEELTEAPGPSLSRVLKVLDLSDSGEFQDWVGQFSIENRNGSWKNELPRIPREQLEEAVDILGLDSFWNANRT